MGVRNKQNFITKGMRLIRQGVYVLVAMDAIKAVPFFPHLCSGGHASFIPLCHANVYITQRFRDVV